MRARSGIRTRPSDLASRCAAVNTLRALRAIGESDPGLRGCSSSSFHLTNRPWRRGRESNSLDVRRLRVSTATPYHSGTSPWLRWELNPRARPYESRPHPVRGAVTPDRVERSRTTFVASSLDPPAGSLRPMRELNSPREGENLASLPMDEWDIRSSDGYRSHFSRLRT